MSLPWQAPDYSVLDLHANYKLPFKFGGDCPSLYLQVFNALDAVLIQDIVDNSQYNGWKSSSSAEDAEVCFGTPTSFN